ncbi:MAG TPA: alkaline phosphatase family protein [Actinomycetota bacterium]|nr:alkaline phosphatase family protein [Actinomycetota bacterium]
MPKRVLIIGWDGVDWKILRPLLETGELPNLARLIERGAHGDCLSSVPSHSWCAWPSFMTGLNPAGHAVFDILEHQPGVSRRLPVTYRSIKARTIFDDLTDAGKTTIAANIPLTFPAPKINGKVIGGGVLPAARSYTYPLELQQELDKNAPFPVNGMSWTTFRNRPEAFLDECAEITAKRQKTFEYLLDTTDWDFATLVYVSTDRIQHCLMEYIHPEHPAYPEQKNSAVAKQVRAVYQQLDDGLAKLLERTTEDDLVVFMSDHGHQACTRTVTMDRVLQHLGFLEFSRGSFAFNLIRWGPGRRIARRIYDLLKLHGRISIPASPIEWSKTRAYTSVVSTGEGVSVNLKGREPGGTVDPKDYEKVRDEVFQALEAFRDPGNGKSPISKIYRKEEILSGRFLDTAPDLLLVPAPFYSLTHAKGMTEEADWLSGDHRIEGVVVATGPEVKPGPLQETAELIDLGPTSLAALGVPTTVERDGKVLASLVGDGVELKVELKDGDGGPADAVDPSGLSSDEEGEIEDHLRGLGYVE